VRKSAVVLLSGGMDSATALYWAKSRGYAPVALCARYGQRHSRELVAARAVAKAAQVPLHVVDLHLPWLRVSSLLDKSKKLPDLPLAQIGRGGIPSTYVPGRNTIFLALGVSLADALGANAVVLGANALDYSGYPDCRLPFLRAFGKVARLGTKTREIKILAPLTTLDKRGIVRLALKLRVPLKLTWSCYAGGSRPCGRCDSCKLRGKGFSAAGLEDPAL
jgi:7-cyano-7-deazaguanine synthase